MLRIEYAEITTCYEFFLRVPCVESLHDQVLQSNVTVRKLVKKKNRFNRIHYRKLVVSRVPESLSFALSRAHGKEHICRVHERDTRQT